MHYFTLPPDSLAYWLQFQLLLTFALHPHCSSAFPVSSFCSLFSQLLLFQPNLFLIGLHVFSLPVCVCLGALGEHWQSSFWWWLKVNLHHWCTHSLTHSVTHISRCIIVSFRLPWCRSPGSQLHSFTPFSHFSLSPFSWYCFTPLSSVLGTLFGTFFASGLYKSECTLSPFALVILLFVSSLFAHVGARHQYRHYHFLQFLLARQVQFCTGISLCDCSTFLFSVTVTVFLCAPLLPTTFAATDRQSTELNSTDWLKSAANNCRRQSKTKANKKTVASKWQPTNSLLPSRCRHNAGRTGRMKNDIKNRPRQVLSFETFSSSSFACWWRPHKSRFFIFFFFVRI